MRKSKKAMTMNVIIMMIIGLVVLAMMIYIANRYIIGTAKSAGELSGCENQNGNCKTECNKDTELKVSGMGCKKDEFCCLKKAI